MEVTWGGGRAAQSLRIERQKGKMSALDGGLISKAEAYPPTNASMPAMAES